MTNRFAGAQPALGTCPGCGTVQPLIGCRDRDCPSNDPWMDYDAEPTTTATPDPVFAIAKSRLDKVIDEWVERTGRPREYWRKWNHEGITWIDTDPPGKWAVHGNNKGWHIIRLDTGGTKFIGRANAGRYNYFDRAMEEATRRNKKEK